MERHKCKLCFKIFINGKALGGHMRSHLVNLPVSDDRRPNRPKDPKPTEETSSSSSDPEFPVAGSVVLQDRESETESSKNPTRRRSKRIIRKFKSPPTFRSNFEPRSGDFKKFESESWTEQEPVSSSISDVTTEEDVAFCLMMMSRDKWKQRKKPEIMSKSADDEETDEDEDEDEEDEDEEETDESEGKYTCETCTKTFRSYQALGGHRASHRKNQEAEAVTVARAAPPPPDAATSAAVRGESKVHECPYCFRVFGSGQALGGHKRSHAAIYGSVSAAVPVNNKKVRNNTVVIDLNLPAPVDDGEYGEVEL